MSEAWAEGLSRRRSAHDAFSRTASAFAGITQEELDELKELYFLDEQQVQTYVTSFHQYDEDKSGDIDCKELGLLLRDLGINLPPADVFDMIQAVDLDGSGSIGLPEFITLIADPDGPLGVALETFEGLHIDPRQAWLKRKHLEVRIAQDVKFRASRANFADNLNLRNQKFRFDALSDPSFLSESGRKGWAGGGGCQAVCVSENGLLLAAADGGGNVVVFRKFPKWELYEDSVPGTPRLDAQDAGTSDQPLKHLSFSPTSSCAGSQRGGGGMKTFADDADNGYQPVALLRHEHRVRALSWATEPGQPVLAAGSADGRVRLWRPMGEAEVDVNVCGARLKNIKAGKEEIYAVVSIGQKIRLGPEAVLDWNVDFADSQDNAFVVYNSRQVINVVLYVKPKQRKVGVDGTGGAGADSFTRADSLGSGLGNDGEGTMAKLIKKQQILVGKGKAPRLFDRVTISEEFYQIYVSPVDLNRTGTIVGILKGGAECVVDWDPLPDETPPKTPPQDTSTHKEGMTQTDESVLKDASDKAAKLKQGEEAERRAQGLLLSDDEGDEDKYVDDKFDEVPLKEFPFSIPGALPTGLGNEGRVGQGRSVYSLALHSRAVARSQIPVYDAAAATELSANGSGGWFEVHRINAEDKIGMNKSKGDSPTDGASAASSKVSSTVPQQNKPEDMDIAPAAQLQSNNDNQVAADLGSEDNNGSRAASQQTPEVALDADAKNEHLAYTGQIRVRCSWLRFPEIWEWKTCAPQDRHKGEVTSVTFSWRDWDHLRGAVEPRGDYWNPRLRDFFPHSLPPGSQQTAASDLTLTSCCLGGQMKNWTWTWNTSFATDAEGVVMCSIYDRDDMHRENESRGINSRHGSRSGSRTGTRGSNGTGGLLKGSLHFSTDDAQDASIRVAPIMSEEHRELQAKQGLQATWEREWDAKRKLAHDGLHIQEEDLKFLGPIFRLASPSYDIDPYDENISNQLQGLVSDSSSSHTSPPKTPEKLASGLNWENIGKTLPTVGEKLENTALSQQLQKKALAQETLRTQSAAGRLEAMDSSSLHFTEDEWREFGIARLRSDHFIKAGTSYFRPSGQDERNEKQDMITLKTDTMNWHGLCVQFAQNQTIWSHDQLAPDPGGGKRKCCSLFASGSDGHVHVAHLDYLPASTFERLTAGLRLETNGPSRDRKELSSPSKTMTLTEPQSPQTSLSNSRLTARESASLGITRGSSILEESSWDIDRDNDEGALMQVWVFWDKLYAAGGIDADREAGHPRLGICPVDNSLLAICSGLSLELWVHEYGEPPTPQPCLAPRFSSTSSRQRTPRQTASGLRWRNIGKRIPGDGVRLNSAKLSDALRSNKVEGNITELTDAEWMACGVAELHLGHFIKSGAYFFQPVEVADGDEDTAGTSDATSEDDDNASGKAGVPRVPKWHLLADLREHCDQLKAVAWRLDGRLLASADSCGHVKFWGRGCDKGIQSLQKFSAGSGGWRCYQTLKIPLSMHKRVPEEAKDFTRASSAPTSAPSSPPSSLAQLTPSRLSAQGSVGSLDSMGGVDIPEDTCAQVQALAFGVGPCVSLLFVGLEDDTVCIIDTEGLASLLETPHEPQGDEVGAVSTDTAANTCTNTFARTG